MYSKIAQYNENFLNISDPNIIMACQSNATSVNNSASENSINITSASNAHDPVIEDPHEARFGAGVYRRELPETCIAFNSEKGRTIFREAIKTKYMNIHYTLLEQFQTQANPYLCAFGTISMVLNALRVDPGRRWKLGWRWYDDYNVRTCAKFEDIEEVGIDFDEFCCAIRSNHLDADVVRVSPNSSYEHFR